MLMAIADFVLFSIVLIVQIERRGDRNEQVDNTDDERCQDGTDNRHIDTANDKL